MEIDVNLTTLCYKCDRNAIAYGDGERPLCPRHATIFVKAPGMLESECVHEHDKPEERLHKIERELTTESPDSFVAAAEKILTRLSTLDALIDGMRTLVNGEDRRIESIETPAREGRAVA